MRTLAFAAALPALAAITPALAQQVLYTPVPPKGSGYVRLVNALDAPAQIASDFLPATTLGAATTDRIGGFTVVERAAGRTLTLDVTTAARHGHVSFTTVPGGFVTLILRPAGATDIAGIPVPDQSDFNQTKSHLSFYNATATCTSADLKLQPSNAAVFATVPPGTSKSRSVNPVTATVIPDCDTTPAPAVALKGLEAGGMYSIWLMQPAPATTVTFISRDSTIPWKP